MSLSIKIKRGPHTVVIPRGLHEIAKDFLVKAGFKGEFLMHMGAGIKCTPGKPSVRVMEAKANAIYMEFQTGNADDGRACRLMLRGNMKAEETFKHLRSVEAKYYPRNGNRIVEPSFPTSSPGVRGPKIVATDPDCAPAPNMNGDARPGTCEVTKVKRGETKYAKLAEILRDHDIAALLVMSIAEKRVLGIISREHLSEVIRGLSPEIGEIPSPVISQFIKLMGEKKLLAGYVKPGGERARSYQLGAWGEELLAKHNKCDAGSSEASVKAEVISTTSATGSSEESPLLTLDISKIKLVKAMAQAHARATTDMIGVEEKLTALVEQIEVLQKERDEMEGKYDENARIVRDPEHQKATELWKALEEEVAKES